MTLGRNASGIDKIVEVRFFAAQNSASFTPIQFFLGIGIITFHVTSCAKSLVCRQWNDSQQGWT
jgi:hypothetical protein